MQIYDGRNDIKAPPTNRTANVISAGRCICSGTDHMTIRTNGRRDWSLFCCVKGIMYIDDIILRAHQAWIYPPDVPHRYIAAAAENTVYRYLHFNGQDIGGLLDSLAIRSLMPLPLKMNNVEPIFDRLECDAADGSPLARLNAECRILKLFALLASDNADKPGSRPTKGLMKRITDDMEHNSSEPYDAKRYADMLKISVSRFNHLFSETVGIPPHAYYINQRMENARGLLENTDLKINEIAARTGFNDPLYFTQAFRRYVGMTPTEFRKQNSVKK